MPHATNYRTIVLITNSIKISIIYHLNEARFHLDYWGENYKCTRRLRIDYSSIEENEETVDKKDIEELETQISTECIKVYN